MKKMIERFDTLSDAIIAIVMTILVLEIQAPTTSEQMPDFIKEVSLFLISFILLINIWYRRTKLMSRTEVKKMESLLLDISAHGLMSLFPLAIKMLVSFEIPWVSVLFFGILNVLVITLLNLIPIIEQGSNWKEDQLETMVHQFYHHRMTLTLLLNLFIILLAFSLGRWGVYLYLGLPLVDFYANYRRDKRFHEYVNQNSEEFQSMFRERMEEMERRRNQKVESRRLEKGDHKFK
ncbi:TMEM175 family protein [Streptococcus loxodontisalivarius]|uniref:Membrane protein n=1 Tax=Streptococcus loxodontisalivarius TaxID=1349415 RepID=A0ABS2PR05_9STRE|nr:TMEM175 family protein [Streptococcus loxodontisalivarius]MBM7641929.1 putative membrane protein [Streptococcus loxodontisalivarius]